MTTRSRIWPAALAGAMAMAFVGAEAAAEPRRPMPGPNRPVWVKPHPGWDRHRLAQRGWGAFGGVPGVAIVDGTVYGDGETAPEPVPQRDPSFGGYVYRAGRAADGSVYANYYRSYQPYAPPVIIRIP